MRKVFLLTATTLLAGLSLTGCGNSVNKADSYTKDGKLKISISNLYFGAYKGGDDYLKNLENEFKVKLTLNSYPWAEWETKVNSQVTGGTVDDVFHADVDAYNYNSTYKFWADDEDIKPLPSDMSRWPNIQHVLENTTNIDALKINGKLYGIPVAKNTTDFSTTFSPFTYIYRKDWAERIDQDHKNDPSWTPITQENDEYTWEEFEALLKAFKNDSKIKAASGYALGDVEWGYPSIINFFKPVPHCYAYDEEKGKYVNNYTTEDYLDGMDVAKSFKTKGYYYPSQNSAKDGQLNTEFSSNRIGVLYENLSYSNYMDLRTLLKTNNAYTPNFNLDKASAIMKIRSPEGGDYAGKPYEGKYALEGTDNWFSMTFFDARISDNKMKKVLDILDWLLDEEGTRYAIYGEEGYDWEWVDGEIHLLDGWEMVDGKYVEKDNGAKYLRYMVSLGYDTLSYDPITDKDVVAYLENWESEMNQAYEDGDLRVLIEDKDVRWLTTKYKAAYSLTMRKSALNNVMLYMYNKEGITTRTAFKDNFDWNTWNKVLDEINKALGK